MSSETSKGRETFSTRDAKMLATCHRIRVRVTWKVSHVSVIHILEIQTSSLSSDCQKSGLMRSDVVNPP